MDAAVNVDDVRSSDQVERLLEDTWSERGRSTRRQLLVEAGAAAAFLLAAGALIALAPPTRWNVAVGLGLLASYALLSRVEFPIGRGCMVPTQLALVPMLFAVPPSLVPVLVAAGLVLGAFADRASGRGPAERALFAVPNAWHAIAPAAVIAAAGHPEAELGAIELLAAAFVAQCAVDMASGALREWSAFGTPPRLTFRVQAKIALVDALLTPLGFLAAHAGRAEPLGFFLAVPLAGLLLLLARDRTDHIRQSQDRLEAVRRERARLQRAIQRIGEAFASTLDFEALLEVTLRAAADAVDADGGRTSLVRAGAPRVEPHVVVGDDAPLAAALAAAEGQVLRTGEPAERHEDGATALAWPIGGRAGDRDACAGVVSLARRGQPFQEFERSLLSHLVSRADLSVENIALHERLRVQAGTDALTGLANRRGFEDALQASVARHRATRSPLALVLLDLDNFKGVNDGFGHQAGDAVLRECARAIRRACRAGDAPARYGGEELAVILAGAGEAEAADFAERLRASVAATCIPVAPGGELRVTASFGVACLGADADDAAELLAAADRALYAAKRTGKNRVVLAGDAVARPGLHAATDVLRAA